MNDFKRFIEESLRRSDIIDSTKRQIKPIVEHLAKLIVCREGNGNNTFRIKLDDFLKNV